MSVSGPGHDLPGSMQPLDREPSVPRLIKAEANLLRLPLFALDTKGLRTLDAIECRGRLRREDGAQEFVFRASRSATMPYPGPLARSAHLALLSIATEAGFPLKNPIAWRWRDLCRRMGVSVSGRTVERLKAAIASTAALTITSAHAIYSKPAGRRLLNREEVLHLYDRVCFLGSELPEGGVAEANYVWFSEWYLGNLNAFFTAPLDYELWLALDQKSPIASRLYEFLLLNFYNGMPVLRINYARLAQFLPIRTEKHPSQAKQQLGPALALLAQAGILAETVWGESRDGLTQLHFHRGPGLEAAPGRPPLALASSEDDFAEDVEVEELRTPRPPEWLLVGDFYRAWTGQEGRPTRKEMAQAKELIEEHGSAKAKAIVQIVVKKLKKKWPEAKTFGGVARYLDEAAVEFEAEQRRVDQDRAEQNNRKKGRDEEEQRSEERMRFEAVWRPVWEALSNEQKEQLQRELISAHPYLQRVPRMVEALCLDALARRSGDDRNVEA